MMSSYSVCKKKNDLFVRRKNHHMRAKTVYLGGPVYLGRGFQTEETHR
jgi:putative AlgH/UPF0301 family transcriptional regulator